MDAATRTFISSTFWTERIGPTAALAALEVMAAEDAPARVHAIGLDVRTRWEALAAAHDLPLVTGGLPALGGFRLDGRDPALVKSYVTLRMLAVDHLAGPALYASIAHTPAVLERYLDVLDAVFADLARLDDTDLAQAVGPEPAWMGFGRLV